MLCVECKSAQDRIDRIVELLREKGLEGEPTLQKCRQLRKEILAKREIEDLDPNLIIQAEGSNCVCLFLRKR